MSELVLEPASPAGSMGQRPGRPAGRKRATTAALDAGTQGSPRIDYDLAPGGSESPKLPAIQALGELLGARMGMGSPVQSPPPVEEPAGETEAEAAERRRREQEEERRRQKEASDAAAAEAMARQQAQREEREEVRAVQAREANARLVAQRREEELLVEEEVAEQHAEEQRLTAQRAKAAESRRRDLQAAERKRLEAERLEAEQREREAALRAQAEAERAAAAAAAARAAAEDAALADRWKADAAKRREEQAAIAARRQGAKHPTDPPHSKSLFKQGGAVCRVPWRRGGDAAAARVGRARAPAHAQIQALRPRFRRPRPAAGLLSRPERGRSGDSRDLSASDGAATEYLRPARDGMMPFVAVQLSGCVRLMH